MRTQISANKTECDFRLLSSLTHVDKGNISSTVELQQGNCYEGWDGQGKGMVEETVAGAGEHGLTKVRQAAPSNRKVTALRMDQSEQATLVLRKSGIPEAYFGHK